MQEYLEGSANEVYEAAVLPRHLQGLRYEQVNSLAGLGRCSSCGTPLQRSALVAAGGGGVAALVCAMCWRDA